MLLLVNKNESRVTNASAVYVQWYLYVANVGVAENMCSDFQADYWKVARTCRSVYIFCYPLKIVVFFIKSVIGIFQSDLKESTFWWSSSSEDEEIRSFTVPYYLALVPNHRKYLCFEWRNDVESKAVSSADNFVLILCKILFPSLPSHTPIKRGLDTTPPLPPIPQYPKTNQQTNTGENGQTLLGASGKV